MQVEQKGRNLLAVDENCPEWRQDGQQHTASIPEALPKDTGAVAATGEQGNCCCTDPVLQRLARAAESTSDLGLSIRAWRGVESRSTPADRQGSLPHLSERELQEVASAVWAGYHTGTAQPSYTILICQEASVHPQRDALLHLPLPPQRKQERVGNLLHLFYVE